MHGNMAQVIASSISEPQPVRVLVVDDELPIRLLCRVNLEAEGLEVQEAATGEDALTIAGASPPDVAVVDVMLPGIDGWEVAERLHADARTRDVAVIILTATAGVDAQRRAEEMNLGYLAKPFDPMDFPNLVRRAAANRAQPA